MIAVDRNAVVRDAARTASEREHAERLLDEALGETFPASDAVSVFVPPPRDARGWTAPAPSTPRLPPPPR